MQDQPVEGPSEVPAVDVDKVLSTASLRLKKLAERKGWSDPPLPPPVSGYLVVTPGIIEKVQRIIMQSSEAPREIAEKIVQDLLDSGIRFLEEV